MPALNSFVKLEIDRLRVTICGVYQGFLIYRSVGKSTLFRDYFRAGCVNTETGSHYWTECDVVISPAQGGFCVVIIFMFSFAIFPWRIKLLAMAFVRQFGDNRITGWNTVYHCYGFMWLLLTFSARYLPNQCWDWTSIGVLEHHNIHYGEFAWALSIKSPITRLFIRQFVQAKNRDALLAFCEGNPWAYHILSLHNYLSGQQVVKYYVAQ